MIRVTGVGVAVAFLLLGAFDASGALVFNITNQGAASAQMMTGMAQAAALWSARLNDSITINVRINAVALPAGQIGSTGAFFDPFSYSAVRQALINDMKGADDTSSTSKLQAGGGFSMLINRTANSPTGVVSSTPYFDTGQGGPGQAGPENNSTIRMTTANAKAIGLLPNDPTLLDATINFTTLQAYDFDRSNGISANQVDFVGIAAHEIGHMLGFISGADTLDGNGNAPGLNDDQMKFVTPIDLFRFSPRSLGSGGGIGVNDWTADNTSKYFSVDGGATAIATFSNGINFGDGVGASHWKDNLGLGIMDPSAANGELLSITNNDLRAMDAIGYDVVPEPSALMLLGIGGAAGMSRRPRK